MSNEDKSRKTEQPTRKKLRDARERGQVARSKEIVLVALAVAMSIALWTMWDGILDRCLALIALPADYYAVDFDTALTHLTATIFTLLAELLVPLALLVLIIAVLFNVLQFGFLFTVEPIIPRLSKINPIEGVKRLVSVKSLIDFLLSLAKTGLIKCR